MFKYLMKGSGLAILVGLIFGLTGGLIIGDQGARCEAVQEVLAAETSFDANPRIDLSAEGVQPNIYEVEFPALHPGDKVTVRFLVTGATSPDPITMTFAMPTTETLTGIYREQYRQAQTGLDQVMKALAADPDSVIDTAIYQQNVVGERAALKRVAAMIRPILIGRGVNGVIRAKAKAARQIMEEVPIK